MVLRKVRRRLLTGFDYDRSLHPGVVVAMVLVGSRGCERLREGRSWVDVARVEGLRVWRDGICGHRVNGNVVIRPGHSVVHAYHDRDGVWGVAG